MKSNNSNQTHLFGWLRITVQIASLLCWLCVVLVWEGRAQNWNFETGDLRGWSRTGNAFDHQPTLGDNVAARSGVRSGHEGNNWVGTYENRHTSADMAGQVQGDEPTGTLVSSEFEITSPELSFLIGGGNDINLLRVELLVRIRPGEPLPPEILGLLGVGQRINLSGVEYFVGIWATGRNSESMRREIWNLEVYLGRRARIRIKDASTRSWGHINADDFRFNTISQPTVIHVSDEMRANVKDAEVYVNGGRVGLTDISGNLTLSTLSTADNLIARKLVFEKPSHRANHATGSTQNWSYRVYNTSAPVNNDGTVTSLPVTDPAVVQELQLNRQNSIIGLHLVASVEWDAAPTELMAIRDDKINPASQFLYNATDGQFFIEQVELVDDATFWDDADYRIYANWSLRENGTFNEFNARCFLCPSHWMSMQRNSAANTFVHEFGHYGFDVNDEYADGSMPGTLDPNVHCTSNVDAANCLNGTDSTVVDFGTYQAKSSCIMWVQNCTAKLCSNRSDNPHARGTRQGDRSCWSKIAEKFRDSERERSFFTRWALQTPDTRGAVVGTLPNLISGWAPRVAIDNRSRANLCQPFDVTVNDSSGRLAGGIQVWNRTFYDQNILQGMTTGDDPATPADEGGRMTVVGLHVGDQLSAGGPPFVIDNCSRASLDGPRDHVSPNRIQLASLDPIPLGSVTASTLAGFDPFSILQGKTVREVKLASQPFPLLIAFEPTELAGQARVRVRADAELKDAPQVEFSLTGTTSVQRVAVSFDQRSRAYMGIVNNLPVATQGTILATAVDTTNRIATRLIGVSISQLTPNAAGDIVSADGQLSVTIPVGALLGDSRVGIGLSLVPPPVFGEGTEIVSGPFNIAASTGMSLATAATLRFQLPPQSGKRSGAAMFYPESFEVLHYDIASGRWQKVGGTLLPAVAIVALPITELGGYLLTARRLGAPASPKKFQVTGLWLSASPAKYEGACPATISFSGEVEADGPGMVQYSFVRSDGATGPVRTLVFKAAGKQPVNSTWSLGSTSLPSYSGWQTVKIISPMQMESKAATFAIQCSK